MPRHGGIQSLVANLAQTKCPKAGKMVYQTKRKLLALACDMIKRPANIVYPCSREAFIAVVLLCIWSADVHPQYHLVELFSGAGKVGEVWRPILKNFILIFACTFLCMCCIYSISAHVMSGRTGSMWANTTGITTSKGWTSYPMVDLRMQLSLCSV